MAALSADRETPIAPLAPGVSLPVAASTIIYMGSIVANLSGGGVRPAADTASYIVMGLALEQQDNSGGALGDKNILIQTNVLARFDAVETVRLHPGSILYLVDDHTVGDATGTNSIKAGICWQKISPTEVWLYMDPAAVV